MITEIIVDTIQIKMLIGICDFEYLKAQTVIVNIRVWAEVKPYPKTIEDCWDYSKICEFVKSWENRKHVDLVETLIMDVHEFCFNQDKRVNKVAVEILKPDIIEYAKSVGVRSVLTRSEFLMTNHLK